MSRHIFFIAALLFSQLLLAQPQAQEPILGVWVLDHALTQELAKALKVEILPLPEKQTDYFVLSDEGSILNITVKQRVGEKKEDVCHFPIRLDGQAGNEYCASKGNTLIDKIISKRISPTLYRFEDGGSKEPDNKWTGSFEITADGKQLTVKFDIPGKNKFLKVFRKAASF